MLKLKHILYLLLAVPIIIILFWTVAVPTELIEEKIEEAISNAGNADISADVTGLHKGMLLSLHADSIDIEVSKKKAISFEDLSISFSPAYIFDGELALLITGHIGTGEINGLLKFPIWGKVTIDNAKLNAIPYLTQFGIDINGSVFSEIHIEADSIKVTFDVPDLSIGDDSTIIPLLNTFRKLRGSLSVKGNTVMIDSVSLEGEKGYARLKGDIKNGVTDLSLELMPDMDKLKAMESMLIGKYIISPGYYVVPIKNRLY